MLKYTISEHMDLVSDETAPEYLRGAGEDELSEIYAMCSTAVAENRDEHHGREMLAMISELSARRGDGLERRLRCRWAAEQVNDFFASL